MEKRTLGRTGLEVSVLGMGGLYVSRAGDRDVMRDAAPSTGHLNSVLIMWIQHLAIVTAKRSWVSRSKV